MARPRKARAKRRIAQRTARNHAAKQTPVQQDQRLERARTQPPIERYFARSQITMHQRDAGTRFYSDWLGMGGHGSLTAAYGHSVPGHDHESPYQVRCYQSYRSAVQAVGQFLSPVLFSVCVLDESARDWARQYGRSEDDGIAILRLALDALAVHYGFMRHAQMGIAKPAGAVVGNETMLAEVSV